MYIYLYSRRVAVFSENSDVFLEPLKRVCYIIVRSG